MSDLTGAIPLDDETDPNATDPQGSAMGASLQAQINKALGHVNATIKFGRKAYGLEDGGQAEAPKSPGKRPETEQDQEPAGAIDTGPEEEMA